jgi:hypothetical protein
MHCVSAITGPKVSRHENQRNNLFYSYAIRFTVQRNYFSRILALNTVILSVHAISLATNGIFNALKAGLPPNNITQEVPGRSNSLFSFDTTLPA